MKVQLFEMNGSKLTFATEALTIEAFREIWDRDTSEEKETALGEFAYVLWMSDYLSPYRSLKTSERSAEVIKDVGLGEWEPDDVIGKAIEQYERLQETPSMGFLKSARKAAENLREFFDQIDLNERDKSGKPVYKPSDVTTAIANSVKIIEALDRWEEKVKIELSAGDDIIRGGGQSGPFESADSAKWLTRE